jgi:hypothetical protein
MPGLPPEDLTWGDLLGPDRAPDDVQAGLAHEIGWQDTPITRQPAEPGPDVSGLRDQLGIRAVC